MSGNHTSTAVTPAIPWRVSLDEAEFEENVRCVVMPCCCFAFSAEHLDTSGDTYTCPCCAPKASA